MQTAITAASPKWLKSPNGKSGFNFVKYQRLTFNDILQEIQDSARTAGANGIIIDKTRVVISGIISRGIEVSGRAISH